MSFKVTSRIGQQLRSREARFPQPVAKRGARDARPSRRGRDRPARGFHEGPELLDAAACLVLAGADDEPEVDVLGEDEPAAGVGCRPGQNVGRLT